MRPDLPTGTVTFLFTDVEGSTRLLHELGAEGYAEALAEHRRVIREACVAESGVEVDTQGDAFFFAFPTAPGALAAAAAFTEGLARGPIRVRVGLHTGEPLLGGEGYVGEDVHFAARVAAASHGGQVVVSAETAVLVGDGLVSLGSHRLKDVPDAVAIFQLGDGSFPPLKTIANTNLPTPASSFLGREEELFEADELLRGTRLLTVSGPGGAGKTRFALELARRAREGRFSDYPDGVFSCFLSSLRDASLVLPTIAQTLSVVEQPGLSGLEALASHLAGTRMLLLLDNAEHLLEAASELSQLLEAASGLTLLVTSRELLRIRGETTYELPPLPDQDAVVLFCERAQVEPSEPIRELCARLEGLPLALELAAARLRILTPEQLLDRLSQRLDLLKAGRDADPRQQTLRATIEWSYDLLGPVEQQLFAALSVFAGGCTLEAAEQVADADLDTLQSLVDKSLLRFTDGRYWMLETIREYAGERLEVSGGAAALVKLHVEHFHALAAAAEPHIQKNPDQWLDRLEREHDNFRAALDRLEASGGTQRALRLAGGLAGFWDAGGHLGEGRQRLENLLRSDERSTDARAKALAGAALMTRLSGDAEATRLRAGEALVIYRELGDVRGTAHSSLMLGLGHADAGDFSIARQLFDDSTFLFREAGEHDNALFATRLLGWMYEELGDSDRARAVHEENLGRARALANTQFEAQSLGALASIAIEQGRRDDAFSMMKDVMHIDRDRGTPIQIGFDLVRFARVLAFAGERHADAARLLSCAQVIREKTGAGTYGQVARYLDQALAVIRPQLDESAFDLAWEEGMAMTADEGIEFALSSLD